MSTKHLRAFTALALERNFTRAADRCHLSQPALSTLIQNLEEQAGARLFNRSTRNVELTAEGKVFETVVARLLPDFEHAFVELEDHVKRRKGRVTIAALPSLAGGALAPVIADFRTRFPGINIALHDVTADICVDLVRSRQADFALSAMMSAHPDLSSEPLLSDQFHLVCRDDHPLAARKQLQVRDIAGLPLLQFARSSSVRQHLDAALYPLAPVAEMEVINLVTAAGLIANGIGVTLVPTLALFQFQMPRLVFVPVALPIEDRQISLIRRKDGSDSVASTAFIELLKARWTRSETPLAVRTRRRRKPAQGT